MADVKELNINNTTYTIKDAVARSGLTSKQDTLVSGVNIKTINSNNLLGSGDITIQSGGASRNIGEIVASTIPLTDAGLHLLDGTLISGSGSYSAFVDYIADLYSDEPTASYFAQEQDVSFVQPVLTADGTMGGDSFACAASSYYSSSEAAYKVFDNDTSTVWQASGSTPQWISFYNPVPIKVTELEFQCDNIYVGSYTIKASNDNSTWTDLTSGTGVQGVNTVDLQSNTNYYKYYRIYISSTGGGAHSLYVCITEIKITGITGHLTAEQWWQDQVLTRGACGKFVYDSVANTVRLPKISGFIEGTTDLTVLGDLVEAGLPNITGTYDADYLTYTHSSSTINTTGAFYDAGQGSASATFNGNNYGSKIGLDASRSNSIYGNSDTVQPQSVKTLYYIVISTSTKTDIEVDIDEIATDLNGKADVDGTNMAASVKNFDSGWVASSSTLYNNVTLSNSGSPGVYTTSLATYLPNDGYNYEVLFRVNTDSASSFNVMIHTDFAGNQAQLYNAVGNGDRAHELILIFGSTKTLTLHVYSTVNNFSLYAVAYRRIGTNS